MYDDSRILWITNLSGVFTSSFLAVQAYIIGNGAVAYRKGGGLGGSNPPPPPEIPKALQNRVKLNPIVKTV